MMNIEELVKRHMRMYLSAVRDVEYTLRYALTEQAAGYEKRLQDANLEIDRLRLVIDKCGESELVLCQGINERDERIQLQNARIKELEQQIKREEADHANTLDQRDRAEQAADALAEAVAEHFRCDVGERSNLNNPWHEALLVLGGEYITDSDQDRELDALRKDAERLTWLLRDAELVHQGRGANHWQIGGLVFDAAGELDLDDKQLEMRMAIDASMAEEGQE